MTPPSEPLYLAVNGLKVCSRKDCELAGIQQPIECFPKSKQIKSGRNGMCKTCSNASHRRAEQGRKQRDPEKIREQYRRKNAKQREAQKAWREVNKARLIEVGKKWRRENPSRLRAQRDRARFKKFGVSELWYSKQLIEQNGRCAICSRTKPGGNGNTFHIDHDHRCCNGRLACGKCLRGLLCASCNVRLGVIEAHGWLRKAMAYLRKHDQMQIGF